MVRASTAKGGPRDRSSVMSKATTQRLSERMATRTPPAPARGAPRPPQEHIQPLPYHDSTETQGSPLSPGDSKHGPRSRRPFQPPPNQGGRGGGGAFGQAKLPWRQRGRGQPAPAFRAGDRQAARPSRATAGKGRPEGRSPAHPPPPPPALRAPTCAPRRRPGLGAQAVSERSPGPHAAALPETLSRGRRRPPLRRRSRRWPGRHLGPEHRPGAARHVASLRRPAPPPAVLLRAYMRTRRPAARLPGGGWGAGMSAGGAGPTRTSHRLFYCRRGTGSCGSPEDGFVTWLKPRCARHLSVLPSLRGEVFVGVLWFGGGCAAVSVLSSSSACPLGGGGGG